jgi:hypothetical protein
LPATAERASPGAGGDGRPHAAFRELVEARRALAQVKSQNVVSGRWSRSSRSDESTYRLTVEEAIENGDRASTTLDHTGSAEVSGVEVTLRADHVVAVPTTGSCATRSPRTRAGRRSTGAKRRLRGTPLPRASRLRGCRGPPIGHVGRCGSGGSRQIVVSPTMGTLSRFRRGFAPTAVLPSIPSRRVEFAGS